MTAKAPRKFVYTREMMVALHSLTLQLPCPEPENAPPAALWSTEGLPPVNLLPPSQQVIDPKNFKRAPGVRSLRKGEARDSKDHKERGGQHWSKDKHRDEAEPERVHVPKWYYKDPHGEIQGPFTSHRLREWYDAGYFSENLQVKHEDSEHFVTLGGAILRKGSRAMLQQMEVGDDSKRRDVEAQRLEALQFESQREFSEANRVKEEQAKFARDSRLISHGMASQSQSRGLPEPGSPVMAPSEDWDKYMKSLSGAVKARGTDNLSEAPPSPIMKMIRPPSKPTTASSAWMEVPVGQQPADIALTASMGASAAPTNDLGRNELKNILGIPVSPEKQVQQAQPSQPTWQSKPAWGSGGGVPAQQSAAPAASSSSSWGALPTDTTQQAPWPVQQQQAGQVPMPSAQQQHQPQPAAWAPPAAQPPQQAWAAGGGGAAPAQVPWGKEKSIGEPLMESISPPAVERAVSEPIGQHPMKSWGSVQSNKPMSLAEIQQQELSRSCESTPIEHSPLPAAGGAWGDAKKKQSTKKPEPSLYEVMQQEFEKGRQTQQQQQQPQQSSSQQYRGSTKPTMPEHIQEVDLQPRGAAPWGGSQKQTTPKLSEIQAQEKKKTTKQQQQQQQEATHWGQSSSWGAAPAPPPQPAQPSIWGSLPTKALSLAEIQQEEDRLAKERASQQPAPSETSPAPARTPVAVGRGSTVGLSAGRGRGRGMVDPGAWSSSSGAGAPSLSDIQAEQSVQREKKAPAPEPAKPQQSQSQWPATQASQPQPQAASSQWADKGRAAGPGVGRGKPKSLTEIQAEEAAAKLKRQQELAASNAATGTVAGNSSWAAAASLRSIQQEQGNHTKGSPIPTTADDDEGDFWNPPAVTSNRKADKKGSAPPASSEEMFWDAPSPVTPAARQQPAPQGETNSSAFPALPAAPKAKNNKKASPQQTSQPSPKPAPVNVNSEPESTTASCFGGSLPSEELQKWCAQQLARLTGSDDLTLAMFLYSLTSTSEIREYVSEYLGPKGEDFATEFIRRRNFEDGNAAAAKHPTRKVATPVTPQPTEEPAPAPAANKKKRNKKKAPVNPDLLGFSVNSSEPRINAGEIEVLPTS